MPAYTLAANLTTDDDDDDNDDYVDNDDDDNDDYVDTDDDDKYDDDNDLVMTMVVNITTCRRYNNC